MSLVTEFDSEVSALICERETSQEVEYRLSNQLKCPMENLTELEMMSDSLMN